MAIAFPELNGSTATPWNVLIAGGLAISLLAASFYLVAIGIHTAFDSLAPERRRSWLGIVLDGGPSFVDRRP